MKLEIVTPERELLNTVCDWVTIPGVAGEFQALPGHAPLLAATKTGILSFGTKDKQTKLLVDDGFAEVNENSVTLLCAGSALPEEIDEQAEKALVEELRARLTKIPHDDEKEFKSVQAQIERSLIKMQLK